MLWYSLEAPRRGASNEYPQHMFLLSNKKNIMWIPPFICSYDSFRVDPNFEAILQRFLSLSAEEHDPLYIA